MPDHEILTIDEVAKYLRVSERTVYEWAHKGDIPCGKLGTTWRFKRTDIESWVDAKLSTKKPPKVTGSLAVGDILAPERVTIFDHAKKHDALLAVIDSLATAPQVKDRDKLADEIFAREELMSTGIGFNLAVPHVRLPSVTDLVMAVGISKRDIVDYDSLDEQPVRVICMLAARDDQHAEYLKALGALSGILRADALRSALLNVATPDDAYSLLTQ